MSQYSVHTPGSPIRRMPMSSKRSSSSGQRVAKRSRATVAKKPTVVRLGRQPFPKQLMQTLKYTSLVSITCALGVAPVYFFIANGMYDPDTSGAGHQPYYYDQVSVIYDHYVVLKSRIKVTVVNGGANNELLVTLGLEDDTTAPANAIIQSERPNTAIYAGNCNTRTPILNLSFDAAAIYGGDPKSQTQLQGSPGANPTETSQYAIQIYDVNLSNNTYKVFVEIEYDCVWMEQSTVAQS